MSKARVMREILFHNLYLYRPVIKPSDRFLWVIETSWTRSLPVSMEPAQILISSLGDGAIVPVLLLTSFLAHCSQYWARSCISHGMRPSVVCASNTLWSVISYEGVVEIERNLLPPSYSVDTEYHTQRVIKVNT